MRDVWRVGQACGALCAQAGKPALRNWLECQRCVSTSAAGPEPARRIWKLSTLWKDLNKLSKGKLSAIVACSAAAGFVAGSDSSVDYVGLCGVSFGTFACSAAANALNQIYEVRNDSMMQRTFARPLPAGRLSALQAAAFALLAGATGTAVLATQANSLTACLGAGNIVLYAAVYTPLKQLHPVNTWVGAVVGAIPPLMGWAAAAGTLEPGALPLAAVLFFWQMPHFMALAWRHREDYSRAGFQMISRADPAGARTAAVALRHSLYLLPVGVVAAQLGLVHEAFGYQSVLLSGLYAWTAALFYRSASKQSARLLFRCSLLHLPLFLALYMWHREPNTGEPTWDDVLKHLGTAVGDWEKLLVVHMKGAESAAGLMVFPFSPPMMLPCPYTLARGALPAPAQLASLPQRGAGAGPELDGGQGVDGFS